MKPLFVPITLKGGGMWTVNVNSINSYHKTKAAITGKEGLILIFGKNDAMEIQESEQELKELIKKALEEDSLC